jgi:hypothetical protein
MDRSDLKFWAFLALAILYLQPAALPRHLSRKASKQPAINFG